MGTIQKFSEEESVFDIENEQKMSTNDGQGNEDRGETRDQSNLEGYDNTDDSDEEGVEGVEAPNPLRASGNPLEKWFRKLDVQRMDSDDNRLQHLDELEEDTTEEEESKAIQKEEGKTDQEDLDDGNVDGIKFEYVQNDEKLR